MCRCPDQERVHLPETACDEGYLIRYNPAKGYHGPAEDLPGITRITHDASNGIVYQEVEI